ncbi:hypothetical protein ABVK25_006199 [Lepraria finkii]|uniref:Antifreeze protein n=1 Tax=Lepraria finkii TaxID=1340010 RepID=A0ABR4B6Q4_9LECA
MFTEEHIKNKAMYQLSLPAESVFTSQALTLTKPKDTKAVAFKPVSKGVHKMQYTSVIVLGFLNAFALAVPINQVRAPTPPDASAAVAAGIADGEAGLKSGLAAASAAIAEYGRHRRSAMPVPPEAAAAVAKAKKTASEAIANGKKSVTAGIKSGKAAAATAVKSGEAAAAKGEASGEAAAAAGVKSGGGGCGRGNCYC